jgi:hypothetical protein
MPKILIAVLLMSAMAVSAQECIMTDTIGSSDLGRVKDIQNVKADLTPWKNGKQTCTVTLEGRVDGKWGKGKGDFTWNGQSSSTQACIAAVDLAKKDLLNSLTDSTISNKTVVVCKEQKDKDKPLLNPAVGTILTNINSLRVHPNFPNSFYHNGEECRWYIETAWNGKDITHINGIVCRIDPGHWIIVDKF